MRTYVKSLFLIASLLATAIASASELEPGSPAPVLSIKTWYKGTPVKTFKHNKIYVVEFWATWCGPCRHSIPHVTELAKKFKDVTFIGVGVREDDDGKNVKKFVAEMGDKMNYNVGYSGNKTGMYLTWMKATGQTFIPNAYIVRNNKILWIGHPLDMDQPLTDIKAGTFSVSAAKSTFQNAKVQAKLDADIEAARSEIFTLIHEGKDEEAKTKISQLTVKYPTAKVDDIRKSMESTSFEDGRQRIADLLKNSHYAQAKIRLEEFKKKYPTFKAEGFEFIILTNTDHDAWTKKLHELVAKNDDESLQTVYGAIFRMGSVKEVTPQAQEIIDALTETIQKEELMKYWALTLYYQAKNDLKQSLASIDSAIAAFPISKYKNEAAFLENLKKSRSELVDKMKG